MEMKKIMPRVIKDHKDSKYVTNSKLGDLN